MVNKNQERKTVLENSIRLLESIQSNFDIQEQFKPVLIIQNRLDSYRSELQLIKD